MNRALIIRPSSLGDIVHALPIVHDLHRHRPGLAIDWVAEEPFAAVVALNHGVRASMETKEKLNTYSLAGSWTRRDASTVQIEDIGFATVHGHVDTYVAEGGARRELSPQESIGWATRVTAIQFSSQNATSSRGTDSACRRR